MHWQYCKNVNWTAYTKWRRLLQKWSSSLQNGSWNHAQYRKRKHVRANQIRQPCSLVCLTVSLVHYEFISRGQTMNQEFWVFYSIFEKCKTNKWISGTQPVSSLWQCSCTYSVRNFSQKTKLIGSTATTQLWSLSSRLFLFPKLKVSLNGCQFESVDEVQENPLGQLTHISQNHHGMLGNIEKLLESYSYWRG